MPHHVRTIGHATLLTALVADAVYGVVMLAGYLVMVAGVALATTLKQVALGVLMTLLWGG